MSKIEFQEKSGNPSQNAATGKLPWSFLKTTWEALKPRKLEEFPAYGAKEPEPPSHWKTLQHDYIFDDEDKTADLALSEVNNPSKIILYALGWNSTPAEKKTVIDSFNRLGATVIVLPLTKPFKKIGTMEENIERSGSLLFDPDSILHQYNDKNLPIHIVTHSAGANAYMHALNRRSDDLKRVHNIMGAYHTAPFVDAANASIRHQPIKSMYYSFVHASRHQDDYVGTVLGDRLFYIMNGLTNRLFTEDPTTRPTHGQTLELLGYGRALTGISQDMVTFETMHNVPRETFFYSKDDDFAGHEAIIDLAHERGVPESRLLSVNGAHNILLQAENIAKINELMQENEANHFSYIQRPHPQRLTEEENVFFEQICDLLDIPEIDTSHGKKVKGASPSITPHHAPSHS